jgi:hypothetical protein
MALSYHEVIWLKIFSNYKQGLKGAILAIFKNRPQWPSTVSAALKNHSQDLKKTFLHQVPMNAGKHN